MNSKKYTLNKEDFSKIITAFLWSSLSAVVGVLIVLFGQVELPAQYLFLVPVINTALYSTQKYFSGRM